MKADLAETMRRRLVLFDGGLGSMLIAAGLGEGEEPAGWNVTRPEELIEIHAAYVEAGAEVVQTNTFGANRLKLSASHAGRKLDVAEVNEKGVEVARKAMERSGRGAFLAGEMGPTGLFFPPVGQLTPEDAREAFVEQARVLEGCGVDAFLIETMYDIREAAEALRAVREVSSRPVIVELTFEKKPRGYFTLMGDAPAAAAEALAEGGADVIGSNCTLSSVDMIGLVEEFRRVTEAPLLFQPNAGRPVVENGLPVYRQRPQEFAEDIEKIVRAGANAVGGCCGTTPEFIRAVHERIKRSR